MKKKFLAIDIGNTHITVGIFEESELKHEFRLVSSAALSQEDYKGMFKRELSGYGINDGEFFGAAISSVVDEITGKVSDAVADVLGIATKIIHQGLKFNFINKYKEPGKLGVDRICAVEAAVKKYGKPVIVADFGTATTIEVVNTEGHYLGGVIMPGIKTMSKSLYDNTSRLPEIDYKFPDSIIGENTIDCIKSGVLYGSLFAFEEFVRRVIESHTGQARIVVTGGLARLILAQSSFELLYDPNLVMEGILGIYLENFS